MSACQQVCKWPLQKLRHFHLKRRFKKYNTARTVQILSYHLQMEKRKEKRRKNLENLSGKETKTHPQTDQEHK